MIYDILENLKGKDFGEMKAREFENLLAEEFLSAGFVVDRQVSVPNRGDGRKGRIDLVVCTPTEKIGIEIDRTSARKKSIFKLRELAADRRIIVLRSPFSYQEI